MDKSVKLAFQILASLYPDRKPSEVKKIIEDALSKDANQEDCELWQMMLEKRGTETKEAEKTAEKVIERHYYHDHYPSWYTWISDSSNSPLTKDIQITCTNTSDSNVAKYLCSQDASTSITM